MLEVEGTTGDKSTAPSVLYVATLMGGRKASSLEFFIFHLTWKSRRKGVSRA